MQARVDWLLDAGQPFTHTNSTIPPAELGNVLTTTIIQGYINKLDKTEALVTESLTQTGVLKAGTGEKAPTSLLEELWNKPEWARLGPGGQFKDWVDPNFAQRARDAVIPYAALGYVYFRLGDRPKALEYYGRAVALDPTNYFNQKNNGSLLADAGKPQDGLDHLKAALNIILTYPDVNTDPDKRDNLASIRQEISRVQGLVNK
jgi:tetratricopeptide (TPR) repeat protein